MPDKFTEIVANWGAVGVAMATVMTVLHRVFISDPNFRKGLQDSVKDHKNHIDKSLSKIEERLDDQDGKIDSNEKRITQSEWMIKEIKKDIAFQFEAHQNHNDEKYPDKSQVFAKFEETNRNVTTINSNVASVNISLQKLISKTENREQEEIARLRRENELLKRTERG